MYGLFGKIIANEGQRDALLGHLLKAADSVRWLEGCYLYVINILPDDPNAIAVFEVWRSVEDHRASLADEGVKAVIAGARPFIAGMGDRVEVTPMGGKGLEGYK